MFEKNAKYAPADMNIRGYLSEDHKRKFTIRAGILGAVFFLAQFIIPFGLMMAVMPFIVFSVNRMRMAAPQRGTYFNDAIWYVETAIRAGQTNKKYAMLKKIELGDKKLPEDVEELPVKEPWLLSGEDRLWIISSSNFGWYNKDGLFLSDGMRLGDICRPFLYKGQPAVIQSRPEELSLLVLKDKKWQMINPIELNTKERVHDLYENLQVLSEKEILLFFMRHGNTLYYSTGKDNDVLQLQEEWQVVCQCGDKWQAAWIDDKPAVFYYCLEEPLKGIVGLSLSENQWNRFFFYDIFIIEGMGIYPLSQSDRFFILLQSFPGSTQLLIVEGMNVVGKTRYGSGFPFPRGFVFIMFIPYGMMMLMPLILAIILSGMMLKYRTYEHEVNGLRMPFASLARRAVAQIIDFLFVAGPGAIGFFLAMFPVFDMENMFAQKAVFPLVGFGLILVGLIWMLICLFLFSYLEGKWGVTPGKWLLRIRVLASNLRPCGFGRALVRNLLKFVDGFFNFMVGVMVVSLSENWQRIGDMAARTVVVQVKKNGEVSASSSPQSEQ